MDVRMDMGALGHIAGKVVGGLGLLVAAVSLVRLDGTGMGVGGMLVLYGLGLSLLAGVYRELRATRDLLAWVAYRREERDEVPLG